MDRYDRSRAVACFALGVAVAFVPMAVVAALPLAVLQLLAVPDAVVGVAAMVTYGGGVVASGLLLVVIDRRSYQADARGRRRGCLGCGYSLRHLPPGANRCPECGRRFKPK